MSVWSRSSVEKLYCRDPRCPGNAGPTADGLAVRAPLCLEPSVYRPASLLGICRTCDRLDTIVDFDDGPSALGYARAYFEAYWTLPPGVQLGTVEEALSMRERRRAAQARA